MQNMILNFFINRHNNFLTKQNSAKHFLTNSHTRVIFILPYNHNLFLLTHKIFFFGLTHSHNLFSLTSTLTHTGNFLMTRSHIILHQLLLQLGKENKLLFNRLDRPNCRPLISNVFFSSFGKLCL